jgi:hypothetical protein
MPRHRTSPTPLRPPAAPRNDAGTAAPRGITSTDVDRAADALLHAGQRPTVAKVRATLGRGSPNTVNPLLDAWWSRLAGRLDAGPAALHRVPESVAHAAEGLWLQALAEARRRAAIETTSTRGALARERQEQAVQSQILSLRESELTARLQDRDRRIAQLEIEVDALTTLLKKEQASRQFLERRYGEFAPSSGARRGGRGPLEPAAARGAKRRKSKSHTSVTNSTRNRPASRRTLDTARQKSRKPRR